MKYESLAPMDRSEAANELDSRDWERISVALTRLALHDPDPKWLQGLFLSYLAHDHAWVRGVAAMCLGHVARIHRQLDAKLVVPAIQKLLEDPETLGKAEDALSDIEVFLEVDTGAGEGPLEADDAT